MNKTNQIFEQIQAAAGIVNTELNGGHVYFSVKEMYNRTSAWSSKPSGRFQVNIMMPGETRDRIFRTKIKDGSFEMDQVVAALVEAAGRSKAKRELEMAREANKDIAKTLREEVSLRHTYISAYAGSAGSYCAPSTIEGHVNVQINFGHVDAEKARKILAFAQSLQA